MRLRYAVLVALAVVAVAACGGSDDAVLKTVPAGEAAEILDAQPEAVLLDIRTPDEFAAGNIDGSVNIDFYADDFRARLGALDRDVTYVVYCRSGNRSDSAMYLFDELGFASVYEIRDGILGWAAAGLPIGR